MTTIYLLSPETIEEKNDLVTLMNVNEKQYILYKKSRIVKSRYLNKILEIFSFIKFVLSLKKRHQDIRIIGAPCLRNRVGSIILNIPIVYYLRCLHPNPEHLSSVSDKIDFLFKNIGLNNKFTNNYKADMHIITSPVTHNFLKVRKANQSVLDIGPIWLRDIELKSNGKRRVFFITQSFKEHHLAEAQLAQVEIIRKLTELLARERIELILKVHPRDTDMYTGYSTFNGDALDLLNNVTNNDVIISAFSTLAFELDSIGANVKFVSYNGIAQLYEPLYQRYNIKFTKLADDNDISFLNDEKVNYHIFSPINTKFPR
ncbi:hypothetical protein [Actinobacillus porcinus]|uniref:hypothetical protein n=1 Tax=Actinobacillus porcinus TaxID=51048 RepID=UPI002355042A|nr:hypothetical protein [Actinobacillus porcinus]